MKRAMFVGPIGCGKTTLIQRLSHETIHYNKTQSVEFYDHIIDTPGEFIEHRRMYTNIATTAMDAEIVLMLQSVVDQRLIFPEAFATMFATPVIGIITKIDIAPDKDAIAWTRRRLLAAGANEVMTISSLTGENVDQVASLLGQS